MSDFFMNLYLKKSEVISLLLEHIQLTLLAVLIAVVIGVPLGIFITNYKKLAKIVIGFANLVQAIPSLAILGFLIPVVGIGSVPAIIMVVLYSMLPIIKNTYTGISNINPDMIESAKGVGMTNIQILKIVKIPLAMPMIMAGIRISGVTAVGLMTIAAFVGAGGLGYLVFSGIQTVDNNLILFGAIPAAILALIIDYITSKIEYAVMPNGIRKSDGTMKVKRGNKGRNKKNKIIALVTSLILIVIILFSTNVFNKSSNKIVIASKNFTEQIILGNMLEQLIEAKTDIDVETKLNLGGTQVAYSALKSGSVDLYVEYTGTAYVNLLDIKDGNTNPDEVYDKVNEIFKEKENIEFLDPLGFNNTYALVVRKDTAEKYNLKSISDLEKVSEEFLMGPTIEFANREDGLLGLDKAYNLNFKKVKPIDGGLRYTALMNNESDVIDAFTTDGLLDKFGLKVLEDDKNFFPPYYAAPLIRMDTLKEHPELEEVLNLLSNKITDEKMRKLNYEVDVNGRDPKVVANEFLVSEGYIN
ncbi:glycine betaine ABC transporter substrate-binding protein [Clostridium butyricum]|uniref:ABC transporter permease n=1 Tax=Clostridium butyricum TaxID=1492 RepID=A0A2S7FER7_CLOBU|nr:glycine betaine ABC transporter substrate-binding protein [Clostridium butyricum]KHD15372.1 ABC transporter permease [Clostridium butyricum]PPV17317.1 ABC transporter permease [Clostridium butyricum]